jgi:hypothetical protein
VAEYDERHVAQPIQRHDGTHRGGIRLGNTLAAGTYYTAYSWSPVSGSGETVLSTASAAVTVTNGQKITVTLPAAPTSNYKANVYLSDPNDPNTALHLYAAGVTVSTGGTTAYDITAPAKKATGLWLHTNGTGANENSQHNTVEHFFAAMVPFGVQLSGTSPATNGNSAHNLFNKLMIGYLADAIVLDDADNNTFQDVFTFRYTATTKGVGVDFGLYARANYFHHLQASDGGVFAGPSATGATGNVILGYDRENGQPAPTVASVSPTPTLTPSTSGGSLITATYYYRVSAYDSNGRLLGTSAEASTAVTGPTGSVAFSNYAVTGASQYQIFRGTSAGTLTSVQLTASTSFTDTTASPPTATTPPVTTVPTLTWTEDGRNATGWYIGSTLRIRGETGLANPGLILLGAPGFNQNYAAISLNGFLDTTNYNFLSAYGSGELYINRPSGGAIHFRENNSSGSEQMTLATGGLLGLNQTSPTYGLHMLGGGQRIAALGSPNTPTLTKTGSSTTATYAYAVVAKDRAGNVTLASTASATQTNAATLDGSNYNTVNWTAVSGAVSYDVYRITATSATGNSATTGRIATAVTVLTYNDQGVAASGAVPTRNTTADLTVDGQLTLGDAGNIIVGTTTGTKIGTATTQNSASSTPHQSSSRPTRST